MAVGETIELVMGDGPADTATIRIEFDDYYSAMLEQRRARVAGAVRSRTRWVRPVWGASAAA